MADLYKNIRNRRLELGLSQEELAQKVGYTDRTSIAKIESGKVDLSQSKIIAFAEALETSPAWLMGWEESHVPPDKIRELVENRQFRELEKVMGLPEGSILMPDESKEDSKFYSGSKHEKRMREFNNAESLMNLLDLLDGDDFRKVVKIIEVLLGEDALRRLRATGDYEE